MKLEWTHIRELIFFLKQSDQREPRISIHCVCIYFIQTAKVGCINKISVCYFGIDFLD